MKPPRAGTTRLSGGELVEAPGSAPGSVAAIACAIYRHSRFPDPVNIGTLPPGWKGRRDGFPACKTLRSKKKGRTSGAAPSQQGGVNDPGQGPGDGAARGEEIGRLSSVETTTKVLNDR